MKIWATLDYKLWIRQKGDFNEATRSLLAEEQFWKILPCNFLLFYGKRICLKTKYRLQYGNRFMTLKGAVFVENASNVCIQVFT